LHAGAGRTVRTLLDSEPPYFKGDGILSALVSISASYRITHSWSARVTWNRVVTRYSHDTDVILCGIGYRF
jgi:outer membrane scaffolding protein for murein synthesis (MipA/OmpV family)